MTKVIGSDRSESVSRGTYLSQWDAELRVRQLRQEAGRRGWKLIKANCCSWKAEKDSVVIECISAEGTIKSRNGQVKDWRYKETVFDEERLDDYESDSDDGLTG